MKRCLVIPDTHRPFHDRRAYDLMMQVATSVKIDGVYLLGDYADFYNVMFHEKDPDIIVDFDAEVVDVNDGLDEIDKLFPRAQKVYIEGNHEYRLTRYLRKNVPALYNITDSAKLFEINKRKYWNWIPYGPTQKVRVMKSKLWARHEPTTSGTHVAHNTVVKCGTSVIFGHTHRIQESQIVHMNGENHRGINPGWLGNKNLPVFDYVKDHHQWALGFSIVHILEDGTFFNNTIHIIDYKCMYGGKLFKG